MAEQLELPEPSGAPEASEGGEPAEEAGSQEPTESHDDATLAIAARHALHDEELVAAYAAAALEAGEAAERARASSLVERCAVCRGLCADLQNITTAHRASASLVRAAPRDFRLSADDAARLRPDVPIARAAVPVVPAPAAAAPRLAPRPSLIERLNAAIDLLTRPLGGALLAAGIVGILVGSVGLSAMPASAPVPDGSDRGAAVAPAESAAAAGLGSEEGPKDLASGSPTVDPRIAVVGGSGVVALLGLLLLARSRRRAREAP